MKAIDEIRAVIKYNEAKIILFIIITLGYSILAYKIPNRPFLDDRLIIPLIIIDIILAFLIIFFKIKKR